MKLSRVAFGLAVLVSSSMASASGFLIFEHGADQWPAIAELLEVGGFEDTDCVKDYEGHDRVAIAGWRT